MNAARVGVIARMFPLALATAVCAAAPWAPSAAPPPQAPAPPGGVSPVADAIVLDPRGRPVSGLTADDFKVTVDGIDRKVLAARRIARIRTVPPSPGDAAPSPGRLVLVVVDEGGIARGNERPAATAVARLLDRVAPDERVALVRLPAASNKLVLTSNGSAVRKAARNVVGRLLPPGMGAAAEAAPLLNDDVDATDDRGNSRPASASVRAPGAGDTAGASLEALTERLRQASAATLLEVSRLLAPLRNLPGPKSIFFVSTGIATDRRTVVSLANAAAAARAQVNVVQLAPPVWQRAVFASQPADASSADQSNGTLPAVPERDAGLPSLALATGGILSPAARKVEEQVDRLLMQVSEGYTLELAPLPGDEAAPPRPMAISLTRAGTGRVYALAAWTPTAQPALPPPAAARADRVAQPAVRPGPATTDPELLEVLDRVGTSLLAYVRDLSSVVAEERYEQVGYRGARQEVKRVVRSDFLLLRAEDVDGWTPFRDAFEVDGRPVRDREERLKKLFLEQPDTALKEALRIKEESVRHLLNDGVTRSNVNWPTFTLEFLLPSKRWRFAMKQRGEDMVEGVRALRIDYVETASPTIIQTYDRSAVEARGSIWVDAASGRVLRTRLQTGNRRMIEMTITVTYRPSEALGLWVPFEMREEFASPASVLLTGKATYSNFRRFQVSTAEQIKVPK